MNVGELAALLLRLPNQAAPVCRPSTEPEGEGGGLDFHDPHEIAGVSRWDGDYIGGPRNALIRGAYVRVDALDE